MKTILSLYDYTGNWSKPYKEAGYNVIQIDIKHGDDIRILEFQEDSIHGILAAPPCTAFTNSGAQYWDNKDQTGETLENIALIDAVFRMIVLYKPKWWALENPVGRLRYLIGPPKLYFDPCDYGDPYTKKTCLWGNFNLPEKNPIDPEIYESNGKYGSYFWAKLGGKSEKTKELRSATPLGFARAFFKANP